MSKQTEVSKESIAWSTESAMSQNDNDIWLSRSTQGSVVDVARVPSLITHVLLVSFAHVVYVFFFKFVACPVGDSGIAIVSK